MRAIKEKLNSKHGASFLLALLAFLVAAMVCATIITAATSSVKRVHNDREVQQMQLTLTSAAQLVRDELLASEYTVTTITTVKKNGTSTTNVEKTATGAFKNELKAAIAHVDDYGTDFSADDMTITVSGGALPEVEVSFVMEGDAVTLYKLIFTLEAKNTGETLYLTMPASIKDAAPSSETEQGTTTTTQIKTITWISPIISGIGGGT